MTEALAVQNAAILEQVTINGDLSKLTPAQRVAYYKTVCDSLGLNPFTKPFDYIALNGKLTLYAKRDATDQLRKRDRVSTQIVSRERIDDLYVVTGRFTTPDGRAEEAIGAVCIKGLTGESLANAMMKAETKCKRRGTLSIVGLGWLDESEVSSVEGAQTVQVNHETGEILEGQLIESSSSTTPSGQAPAPVPAQPEPKGRLITEKQMNFLYGLAEKKGVAKDHLQVWVRQKMGCAIGELRYWKDGDKWSGPYSELCDQIREMDAQLLRDSVAAALRQAGLVDTRIEDIPLDDDPEQHTLSLE